MLVAVMIETPVGVANAAEIARVPGVDVVIAANTDLGNFSGYSHDSPEYIDMFKKIHDATVKAGKFFGCTSYDFAKAQPNSADYRFIQGGPSTDGWQPPKGGGAPARPSTTSSSR